MRDYWKVVWQGRYTVAAILVLGGSASPYWADNRPPDLTPPTFLRAFRLAPNPLPTLPLEGVAVRDDLKRALASEADYIALIASRKRSGLVLDYLREEGFSEDDVARVMAPSGLDLGARTPEEIALCVISEIVLTRRGGSGMRMREKLAQELQQKRRLRAAEG